MVENNKEQKDTKDISENKMVAALSYVGVLCLVPLLLKRNSKFAQFHAKQGLLLFVLEIVGFIILFIPVINFIFVVAVLILAIIGIRSALEGRYKELLFLGKYAKKLNL